MMSNVLPAGEAGSEVGFGQLFRPYFDGLSREELRVPKCDECSRHQWPPRSICVSCGSDRFVWELVPDPVGTLFSWTVIHHAKGTEFEKLTPYAVGLINLEHFSIRLYGLLPDPTRLEIDSRVRLVFGGGALERPYWVLDQGRP